MSIEAIKSHAAAAIASYRDNAIIMEFVEAEAKEKVAADIRAKTGSGTTAKGVELLLASGRDKSIKQRFDQYVDAGLVGCYLAHVEQAAAQRVQA